jgi:energy-coupling factor transporter ATP-binding protein EcfA2
MDRTWTSRWQGRSMGTDGADTAAADEPSTSLPTVDPRNLLANWANGSDEWSRYIVRLVLSAGRRLSDADIATAYQLFLEEKQFSPRTLPAEPPIATETSAAEGEASLALISVSDVTGVNALVPGSKIELNAGLTILFGENGTGKTGYARILKLIADSRTADEILPDIHHSGSPTTPSARIEYKLGTEDRSKDWQGERGEAPFTRMAIFDTRAVNFHVDEDLTYVYTPASLALFNHVTHGIQGVQKLLEAAIASLKSPASALLNRFDRGSTIYPMIETIGAASDLDELKRLADVGGDAPERLKILQRAVAALQANTTSQQIAVLQRRERVLAQAAGYLDVLDHLTVEDHDAVVMRLGDLQRDYTTFREGLFAAADLPAPPEETWEAFIRSGQTYREHLEELSVHDESRCLYCRQNVGSDAAGLLTKYRDYLEDKIAGDISDCKSNLAEMVTPLLTRQLLEVETFLAEHDDDADTPEELAALRMLSKTVTELRVRLTDKSVIGSDLLTPIEGMAALLVTIQAAVTASLVELREQLTNRTEALAKKESELRELAAQIELSKSWTEVSRHVEDARKADKLTTLSRKFSTHLRQVTELSKTASDQLINQNFEQLFTEECDALRVQPLQLEFVGRQGTAQRRKVLTGNYKPSKILSEGEQKVLALADFVAEARLTGITAPIVFDDPVCSLDHRRINEVADRVASLAADSQVIVFTHDILFATNLLARFEKSKRCTYFQITDEDGKGKVTRATGPRWDTLSSLKKHVNETIEAARRQDGETRAALVRTGYDWLRSWCEVFVEIELLAEVTQRYQPNVRMTALPKIKAAALPEAIEIVTKTFEDACRNIDGHSQPLPSLGVSPTLAGLEADWTTLKACQKKYKEAVS